MKSSWQTISSGLDQLFFSSLVEDETIEDRSQTIDTFLISNGWSWDEVIAQMGKESNGHSM